MAFRKRVQTQIYNSRPVRALVHQTKQVYIPGFGDYTVYEIGRPFMERLRHTNLSERASAISFNVFMAIPPTLIFIFTLIPYLPISNRFIEEMFTVIRDVVPGEKNNAVIIDFLRDFLLRPRNELLSFGLFLAVIFSSNAMMGLMRTFERDYPGFHLRSGLRRRRTALKLTLIVFALVFLCLLLLIAQGAVLRWLGVENIFIRNLIHNVRWVFIIISVFYIVAFIYRHGPPQKIKWPFITPGSVFATTLMVLATVLVSFYVENFANYDKLYGSIGAVFILMLLIFVNAMVVLLGFELNVTIAEIRAKKAQTGVAG